MCRGAKVAAYRVYCLDGVNRVVRAEWIEAADDPQAVELARALIFDCVKCEVWQGPRLVERINDPDWPEPPDAA